MIAPRDDHLTVSSDVLSPPPAQQPPTPTGEGSPAAAPHRMLRLLASARRLVVIALLIVVWQLATNAGWVDARKFPPPASVIKALITLAQLGQLWPDIAASLQRVVVGFALASLLGVSLGLLLGRSRLLAEYLLPIVEVLRPISVLAWIPLAIIWFGIGNPTAWFIIFLGAFFPIFSNAYLGARAIDPTHDNAARSLGASRWLFVTDVLWPSCTPYILAGMRIGLGVGWMCVIAAELVAAQSGLGYMIQLARTLIDTEKVMAGMVVIGILGYLMNLGMALLERRLTPWRSHEQRD